MLKSLKMMVMTAMMAVALAALGVNTQAAPSYDVTATFNAPTDGGPVEGYRLYQGCNDPATKTKIADITSGQVVQGALQEQGVHYLCVAAFNSTGEGPISEVARIEIDDYDDLPGAPRNLQIQVSCDASCNVTVNITGQ